MNRHQNSEPDEPDYLAEWVIEKRKELLVRSASPINEEEAHELCGAQLMFDDFVEFLVASGHLSSD